MKRVGVIGAGTMGGVHAEAWQFTAAELVGIYDIQAEKGQALASRLGVQAFPSREALLEAVDIVDVCTPTFTHKEVVVAAAEAGKHVICEKPMALHLEECAAMIRAAEANNVRLFIAQVVRFFPAYEAAKRAIDEGAIGDLGVIRLSRGGSHPAEGPQKWFGQEFKSGGVVQDLMVHDIDYARWLGGDAERVYCKRFLGGTNDYALITIRFRSGAIAHIDGSWAYPTGMFRTGFDIAGNDGVITFNTESTVPLSIRRKTQESAEAGVVVPSSPLIPEDNPYLKEIEHFLECIVEGKEARVTARDAMAAVQIAVAARESALTGKPVTLQPLAI